MKWIKTVLKEKIPMIKITRQIIHLRWMIFILSIFFPSLLTAIGLVGDPDKGVAFSFYGRMVQVWQFEGVGQRIVPPGSYKVRRAYFPPQITLSLPFTPPWVVELDNGVQLSNDPNYADILVQEDHHQMPWLESLDEIKVTHFPWYLEQDVFHVARREYLEYLPAYLRDKGYHQWVDPLMTLIIENEDQRFFFFGSAEYTVALTLIGAVETLPLIVRYRSDRPIAQIHWSVDGSAPIASPALYTIPMHTSHLLIKAYTVDVYGHHAETEITIRTQPVTTSVQRTLHFERIGVGQSLLFPGRVDGVWHVMDQRLVQQNLRWNFEIPGEYVIYQTSPGRMLSFRVWVHP